MPIFQPHILIDFVDQIFQAAGAEAPVARQVATSLVNSNLAGHDSHGVVRVMQYLDSIQSGETDPKAQPEVIHETPVLALVDAHWGFGQWAAHFAVSRGIEKAKSLGMASVGLLNCGHVGRLGEWVTLAADAGQIGLAFCNGGRQGGIVAPFGGAARRLGTNPVAAAVPLPDHGPMVLDFATSAVAEGKVRVARNKGQAIPEGWILDSQGNPSTNPEDLYNQGMLLPAAGHKGFGLALLVDFLGGALTGAGCPAITGGPLRNGVLFVLLDVEAFRPMADFLAESGEIVQAVKSTPPAAGFSEILLPGEPEERTVQQRQANGISVDATTWGQMVDVARGLGVGAPGV